MLYIYTCIVGQCLNPELHTWFLGSIKCDRNVGNFAWGQEGNINIIERCRQVSRDVVKLKFNMLPF